ncbi:unnamed protein product [Adineta ricciae]|uniref:Uncharacterized protein n=1 Tax=Adineta ricciae TaxID=249248 RepID=A0A814TB58_ADIRI|nr:unnamed protein product [Adineta ricciae]
MVSLLAEQFVEISCSLILSFVYGMSEYRKYLPSSNDKVHLVLDWPLQRFILSHTAVKLFISHGGWISVFEKHEFSTGRVIPNTKPNGCQRLIPADEISQYVQQIIDQNVTYGEKAEQLQSIVGTCKWDF